MTESYQIAQTDTTVGSKQLADFLVKEGQLLLPMVQLVEQAEVAIDDLIDVMTALYPKGPSERNVWERAGGTLSSIDLNGEGQTQWYRALDVIRKGGGGVITLPSLLTVVRQDFPNHPGL